MTYLWPDWPPKSSQATSSRSPEYIFSFHPSQSLIQLFFHRSAVQLSQVILHILCLFYWAIRTVSHFLQSKTRPFLLNPVYTLFIDFFKACFFQYLPSPHQSPSAALHFICSCLKVESTVPYSCRSTFCSTQTIHSDLFLQAYRHSATKLLPTKLHTFRLSWITGFIAHSLWLLIIHYPDLAHW